MSFEPYQDEIFLRLLLNGGRKDLLKKRNIHLTGNSPLSWSYLQKIVVACGGTCVDQYTLPYWSAILEDIDQKIPENQIFGLKEGKEYMHSLNYVVLGRESYYKHFLETSLEFIRDCNFIYLSQEDFIELLQYNSIFPYHKGDHRIASHNALKYLSKVGFNWPETQPRLHYLNPNHYKMGERSRLMEMGYSTKVEIGERRRILRQAVKRYGLRDIAGFIAWRLRLAHGRWDINMNDAIQIYENDLDWLKNLFYDDTRFDFNWPDNY